MKPKLSAIIHRLSKVMPMKQAVNESRYIRRELDESKWISAADRRSQLEPLQYILGNQPFGTKLDLLCKPGVLIPRLDTESWVMDLARCLKSADEKINLVDYCSGSGCVGLGLLSELWNVATLTSLDISDDAISLTKENFQRNEDHFPLHTKFQVLKGDLLKREFEAKLDTPDDSINLLVANPPYIPETHMNETNGVEQSVLKYEPHLALIGDSEFYEALCDILKQHKELNGFIFELGYTHQAEYVIETMKKLGWTLGVKHDHNERLRCVTGWKTESLDCLKQFVSQDMVI